MLFSKRFELFVMNNIVAIFSQASISELSQGMQWYSVARTGAFILASEHGISLNKAAGVIAALSPNLKWERNIQAADTIIKAKKLGIDYKDATCSAYKANRLKAYQVLECDNDDDIPVILNGLKITSFYNCIIDPSTDDICIDGHAKCIYFNERLVLKNNSINKTQYRFLQKEYRMATETINAAFGFSLTPSQVQAVTWIVWRRIHGISK